MHDPTVAERWQHIQQERQLYTRNAQYLPTKKDDAVVDDGEAAGPTPIKRTKRASCSSNAELDLRMDEALWLDVVDELCWRPFNEYVNDCRININVRQVLPPGLTALDGVDMIDDHVIEINKT